jgi:hypothetical protein
MIVYYPKIEATKASFQEVKEEFEKALRSAKLIL